MLPTVTRKDIAQATGVSVDTVARKFTRALAPARCRAIEKPLTYFRARANRILLDLQVIDEEM